MGTAKDSAERRRRPWPGESGAEDSKHVELHNFAARKREARRAAQLALASEREALHVRALAQLGAAIGWTVLAVWWVSTLVWQVRARKSLLEKKARREEKMRREAEAAEEAQASDTT